MKVNAYSGDIMAKVGVAIEKKAQDQMKQEGKAAVDLIEQAGEVVGENRPLSEGPVGRTINIKI